MLQTLNDRLDALLDNDRDQFFGDAPDAEAFLGHALKNAESVRNLSMHRINRNFHRNALSWVLMVSQVHQVQMMQNSRMQG